VGFAAAPGALGVLAATAAGIGALHTAVGVDHYLPFIALGPARRWSLGRTLAVTALCGAGHVLSSILLGAVGLALGMALGRLDAFEARRGEAANLLLIGLGLAYAAWGLARARRDREHAHLHVHADGRAHRHPHRHASDHVHPHDGVRHATLVWSLFIIFVFGPCEALIPLLAAAASLGVPGAALAVSAPFAAATIASMLALVALGHLGSRVAAPPALERHAHTFAGLAMAGSGLAVRLLGL
jgi:sulfite exporter TauE/SafE